MIGRFERTLQGAVGDAFARLFGGKVVSTEVEGALRKQAQMSLRTEGGRRIVSNRYRITLARSDYDSFAADEQLMVKTFSRHLADYIEDQGWQTHGPVLVELALREDLHTGQYRVVDGVDPTADPAAVPYQVDAAPPQAAARQNPGPRSDPRGIPQPPAAGFGPPPEGGPVPQPVPQSSPQDRYPVGERAVGERLAGERATERPVSYGASAAPTQITRGRVARTVTLHLEDGSGRTHTLEQGTTLLGRGQDAAFRLPDTGVSRHHAEIRFDGQDAVVTDLESTNGTAVNGGPVQDWQLADGDVIRIGHSEILVRID